MTDAFETRIVSHHIGGRGYGVAFNAPDQFRTDIVHVLYEADAESVEEMLDNPDTPQGRLLEKPILLPYCLGKTDGPAKLNVTANAYASSLLRPNDSFFPFYCEIAIHPAIYDVTYDDMLEVVKQAEVEVRTLDGLFAAGDIPFKPLPDVLSLDTQGMERDIMQGAENTIRAGVLAISTEIEILSMYRGQPLLGDILQQLNEFGFYFAGFTNTHDVSPYRAPVGLRGKGFPGFGDALFLRRLDTMAGSFPDPAERFIKLKKMAFIAINFGHVEYALQALEGARALENEVDPAVVAALAERRYFQFLSTFDAAAQAVRRSFPPIFGITKEARPKEAPGTAPTWYDRHHYAAAAHYNELVAAGVPSDTAPELFRLMDKGIERLRYLLVVEPHHLSGRIRHLVRRDPKKAVAKLIYYGLNYVGLAPRLLAGRAATPALAPRIDSLTGVESGYSAVESVLLNHGFGVTAELVRERRLKAERFIRSLPAEMAADEGGPVEG